MAAVPIHARDGLAREGVTKVAEGGGGAADDATGSFTQSTTTDDGEHDPLGLEGIAFHPVDLPTLLGNAATYPFDSEAAAKAVPAGGLCVPSLAGIQLSRKRRVLRPPELTSTERRARRKDLRRTLALLGVDIDGEASATQPDLQAFYYGPTLGVPVIRVRTESGPWAHNYDPADDGMEDDYGNDDATEFDDAHSDAGSSVSSALFERSSAAGHADDERGFGDSPSSPPRSPAPSSLRSASPYLFDRACHLRAPGALYFDEESESEEALDALEAEARRYEAASVRDEGVFEGRLRDAIELRSHDREVAKQRLLQRLVTLKRERRRRSVSAAPAAASRGERDQSAMTASVSPTPVASPRPKLSVKRRGASDGVAQSSSPRPVATTESSATAADDDQHPARVGQPGASSAGRDWHQDSAQPVAALAAAGGASPTASSERSATPPPNPEGGLPPPVPLSKKSESPLPDSARPSSVLPPEPTALGPHEQTPSTSTRPMPDSTEAEHMVDASVAATATTGEDTTAQSVNGSPGADTPGTVGSPALNPEALTPAEALPAARKKKQPKKPLSRELVRQLDAFHRQRITTAKLEEQKRQARGGSDSLVPVFVQRTADGACDAHWTQRDVMIDEDRDDDSGAPTKDDALLSLARQPITFRTRVGDVGSRQEEGATVSQRDRRPEAPPGVDDKGTAATTRQTEALQDPSPRTECLKPKADPAVSNEHATASTEATPGTELPRQSTEPTATTHNGAEEHSGASGTAKNSSRQASRGDPSASTPGDATTTALRTSRGEPPGDDAVVDDRPRRAAGEGGCCLVA